LKAAQPVVSVLYKKNSSGKKREKRYPKVVLWGAKVQWGCTFFSIKKASAFPSADAFLIH
jgi:hypothetical protein